jgi:hypothetical protein
MPLRLACNWLREQMLARKVHVLAAGPERVAKEDNIWEAAVAEVDDFLDPQPADDVPDPWSDPEWVAAMGGEMAEVS